MRADPRGVVLALRRAVRERGNKGMVDFLTDTIVEHLECLDLVEQQCYGLRPYDVRHGDDASVRWEVIEYHMSEPRERVVARGDTPFKALQAVREGRCANCEEITCVCDSTRTADNSTRPAEGEGSNG